MLQRVLGVSERFACRVVGQPRSTQRMPPSAATPADPDDELRARLRAIAKDNPRWVYRKAHAVSVS
jgi:putative transposase